MLVEKSDNTREYLTVAYRTTDRRRTWSQVVTNTSECRGGALFAAGDRTHWFMMTRWVSRRIRLDATLDAGRTWSLINYNGLPQDAPLTQLIFIGPLSGATFVPNDSPSMTGTLYLTSDGGRNWRPAEFGR